MDGTEMPDNAAMYVIAIAWLYVTLLMAATEPNLIAAILTFSFYGLAPLALFLWLFGTPQRRRNRRAAEAAQAQRAAAQADAGRAEDAGNAAAGKDGPVG